MQRKIYSIYVANLDFRNEEDQVLEIFKEYGYIKNIKIMREGKLNKSKGVAFVDMVDQKQAEEAIKNLNGRVYYGRTLKVQMANTQNFKEKKVQRPLPEKELKKEAKKKKEKKPTGLQALFSYKAGRK